MAERDIVLVIIGAVAGVVLFLALLAAAERFEDRGRRRRRWR